VTFLKDESAGTYSIIEKSGWKCKYLFRNRKISRDFLLRGWKYRYLFRNRKKCWDLSLTGEKSACINSLTGGKIENSRVLRLKIYYSSFVLWYFWNVSNTYELFVSELRIINIYLVH
jgi:hypothetical protein